MSPLETPADPDFRQLYGAYHPVVRRALVQLGVAPGSLDDAVQDVFVVLYRRIEDYDRGRSLKNWLWGIAKGVASTYRRSLRRGVRLRQAYTPGLPQRPLPDDAVARSQALAILADFLATLDADKCAVFMLAEIEGRSGPEIATRLDVNVNTVYARLRAARRRFDAAVARHRGLPAQVAAWLPWWSPLGTKPAWAVAGLGAAAVILAAGVEPTAASGPVAQSVAPVAVTVNAPNSSAAASSPPTRHAPRLEQGALTTVTIDAEGAPVGGTLVCVDLADDLRDCDETDDSGRARFAGLDLGRFRISAVDGNDDEAQWVDLTASRRERSVFFVIDASEVEHTPRRPARRRARPVPHVEHGDRVHLAQARWPRSQSSHRPELPDTVVRHALTPGHGSLVEVREDFLDKLLSVADI